MSRTLDAPAPAEAGRPPGVRAAGTPVGSWWRNPWRKPRILEAITWVYLAWSILPVAIAVWFSFNAGRSRSTWQGFSMRWYWGDPALSVWHDPELHRALLHSLRLAAVATLIAVPIGVAFAIGLDRWRGRLAKGFSFEVLLAFVTPEIILAVALLFLVTNLLDFLRLGTVGQLLGLITFQLSYPVIICRARLLSIGGQYEEAAMDLGASPAQALRRVLLPLLSPAIFASAVIVFADVIDNFVIARYLSSDAATEPMTVKIYAGARAAPTPALNALATIMLLSSLVAVALGFLVYRRLTRGERRGGGSVGDFAGNL
jgi:spermidine/putrescine transport system permease protein